MENFDNGIWEKVTFQLLLLIDIMLMLSNLVDLFRLATARIIGLII